MNLTTTPTLSRVPTAKARARINQRFISKFILLVSDILTILGIEYFYSNALAGNASSSLSSFSFLFLALSSIGIFITKGHYLKRLSFWYEISEITQTFGLLFLIHTAVITFFANSIESTPLVLGWLTAVLSLSITRKLVKAIMLKLNIWQLPTIIIGSDTNAIETAHALLSEKLLGYKIIAFIADKESSQHQLKINNLEIPVKHYYDSPEKFLRRLGAPHVVLALENKEINKIPHYFNILSSEYSNVSVVPPLKEVPLFRAETEHFYSNEIVMLNASNKLGNTISQTVKRTFDITAASIMLLTLLPVFLVIGALVRKSGKQVIFGHKRVGKNGVPFKCYKFRSMVENAEDVLLDLLKNCPESRDEWEKDFKIRNDPRITPIGRFLRKSSLDELPQLWNVIKGEMSLVGPRPIIRDELEYYGENDTYYFRARPGITGLWQVSGRNDIDYDTRVDLDVNYVRNWSFWNDILILLKTVKVVFSKSGAY